jgi:hypothetical protein
MRIYLIILLGLLPGAGVAHAGEGANTLPAKQVSCPSLPPEHHLQKIREALDPATEDEARLAAVCDLARGEYCRRSAEALAAIACGGKYSAVLRHPR